MSYKIGDRKQL